MKTKDIILTLLSIICINITCFSNLENTRIVKANMIASSQIIDNGVYFIRNVGNGQLLDIPNSNYSNNTNIIAYTPHYNGNQRFILTSEFDNSYRIKCLFNQDYMIKVEDDSFLENKEAILTTEQYSDAKLFSDKFKLMKYGSYNKFFIKTGSSDFTKALCIENKDSSVGSNIVQATIPNMPDYIDYYLWEFVKTDSINIYCPETVELSTGGTKIYNLRVPYTVSYKISNDGLATYMELYKAGTKIYQTGVGTTYFEYNLEKNTDYQLKIINTSSLRNIKTTISPTRTMFMYGIYDLEDDKVDRVTPLNNTKNNYESSGLYPIVYSNVNFTKLITANSSGWVPLNNIYSIIHTHGLPGKTYFYDGGSSINGEVICTDFPNLSNVELITFMSCYSADFLNGTTTCTAEEAVRKGAKYSIGYKGEVSQIFSERFELELSKRIGSGYTTQQSIRLAYDDFKFKNLQINNSEPLLYPYVYYSIGSGSNIQYRYGIANKYPMDVYDANTDQLINQSNRNYTSEFENLSKDENIYSISLSSEKIYLIKTDKYYTNIPYDSEHNDYYIMKINKLLNGISKMNDNSFIYAIMDKSDSIHIIEVSNHVKSNNTAFYDHLNNTYISLETYSNLFD